MRRRRHANCALATLGGAPYGATKRVRGVPNRDIGRAKTRSREEERRKRKRGTRDTVSSKRGPNHSMDAIRGKRRE
eukprot:9168977-Pyramimonas_sp.AAC.1